ncbi:hypothetical protein [Treponema endosymbiont of Eucomonympha sp.]|uniref:hypothetical protein n=1 Tax=Treponema endosymbiont of Eucomonympha sp. TaxID=1580831 RepID=UPI0007514407|nr:hypothetical protein [Treponema endosymbiont of Eucomonympha sp.]
MTLYPNPAPRLFDAFDPAGLAVEGAFADGSERLLAAEAYTFDRIPRPEWVGLKVITVRAKENPSLTAQFQIAVDTSDRMLESLSVANAKSAYFFGEPFDKKQAARNGALFRRERSRRERALRHKRLRLHKKRGADRKRGGQRGTGGFSRFPELSRGHGACADSLGSVA